MRFMAHLTAKSTTKEGQIPPLVPAEKARTAELIKEGLVEASYVSKDCAWMVVKADSAEHAEQALKTLPLYPLLDCVLTPLFG